jgi:hypothetical protein
MARLARQAGRPSEERPGHNAAGAIRPERIRGGPAATCPLRGARRSAILPREVVKDRGGTVVYRSIRLQAGIID